MSSKCLFCEVNPKELLFENELAFAIFDRFPVSEGHCLVIPRRHIPDYFSASESEILAIHELLIRCRNHTDQLFSPDGYNIGVNIGQLAGQTIFHLHVHLIPRYRGDHSNPRGGVRHVIPGKGSY